MADISKIQLPDGNTYTIKARYAESTDTTDTATSGSTVPITSGGVYTILGDILTILESI